MKTRLILLLFAIGMQTYAQPVPEIHQLGNDIRITRITENCYWHQSWSVLPGVGRYASNGLIFASGRSAFLFDTPVNDSLTRVLLSWIEDSLKLTVAAFVPNHWHSDCMGGLGYLRQKGIVSYANELTVEFARVNKLPLPEHSFRDSLILNAGPASILCYYPGPAHAMDNIVVWIPSEKVLFGGCMIKDLHASGMGNIAYADLTQWPVTVQKIMDKFPDARIVIPGHGDPGDRQLLVHTLELLKSASW